MNIIGVLVFYDERPSSLAGVIAGLAKVGVSHVVAVDGAFAIYPNGRAYSDREQHATISEVCKSLGMGCTLHAPSEPFVGNEVEKRTLSLRLAETVAEPNVDWYFIVDADHFVVSAIGHLGLLQNTSCDVAAVNLTEGASSMRCRCVLRAIPGLHYVGNHFTITTPDGRNLHSTGSCLDLSCVEVEHRVGQRDKDRRENQLRYYERRDRLGIEGLTCV